jgi:two-component sensor histidine kinase
VVSESGGWRRGLARWLDPTIAATPPPATPAAPAREERAPDPWPAISEQFALRILAAAYQVSGHLEAVEADERDPDRLDKLFRIDHANARVRRQAENLQVLTGRQVEDAGRQVTALIDVVRASMSAIEYYPRVQIGRIADLAVVEFAADDVIRVVTELLDNATRFSPPTAAAIVSAHITELGSVLLRIEDSGVGIRPDQLDALNMMLAGAGPPLLYAEPALHLGLAVVRRLALTHQIRVHLSRRHPSGTTATVLIPEGLICEIPQQARGAGPMAGRGGGQDAPRVAGRGGGQDELDLSGVTGNGRRATPDGRQPAPLMGSHALEPAAGGRPAEPGVNGRGGAWAAHATDAGSRPGGVPGALPVRVPASLRDTPAPPSAPDPFPPPAPDREQWPDETADFAAGISEAQWTFRDPNSEGHTR